MDIHTYRLIANISDRLTEIMAEAEIGNRESRWSLQGMTALVTGGTKGIGFFLCLILFSSSEDF